MSTNRYRPNSMAGSERTCPRFLSWTRVCSPVQMRLDNRTTRHNYLLFLGWLVGFDRNPNSKFHVHAFAAKTTAVSKLETPRIAHCSRRSPIQVDRGNLFMHLKIHHEPRRGASQLTQHNSIFAEKQPLDCTPVQGKSSVSSDRRDAQSGPPMAHRAKSRCFPHKSTQKLTK